MSLLKGPKISKFNAHFIANNIALRLIRDDLTIEDFLRNVEQYLENEIINVCKDCSIEAHESREIAQLVGYIMTEHYEVFQTFHKTYQEKFEQVIEDYKNKGIFYKEYPSDWIDRKIFLINLMNENVRKEFFDFEYDDTYQLEHVELDRLTPVLMINNKIQNKYLKSFGNKNSIFENIKKIFSKDTKKTASHIVNSGEISQELANLVCLRSGGKLSPEDAQSFLIKNRVRKYSGNNIEKIIIKIKSDFPHLSEQESYDLLKMV